MVRANSLGGTPSVGSAFTTNLDGGIVTATACQRH